MNRFATFVLLTVALQAAPCFADAADGGLTGSNPPASGLTGRVQNHHKHRAKPPAAAPDDKASKDAAGAGTAGAAIKTPRIDPAVNKLNTVLPP
jgi:hypothetical protein